MGGSAGTQDILLGKFKQLGLEPTNENFEKYMKYVNDDGRSNPQRLIDAMLEQKAKEDTSAANRYENAARQPAAPPPPAPPPPQPTYQQPLGTSQEMDGLNPNDPKDLGLLPQIHFDRKKLAFFNLLNRFE